MNGTGATFALESVSQEFALFRTLSGEQRMKALNAMVRQDLVRGQMLVAQGGPSDSLFLVLHGALAVCRNGNPEPVAELRAGELVGEIGFFANVPRTADVIAIRDTSVLTLTRAGYQELTRDAPAIVEALLAAVAQRLGIETARFKPLRASPRARTVALIDGGREPAPEGFERSMLDGLAATDAEIVDPARVSAMFPGLSLDAPEIADWLNKLEHTAPLVVYLGCREASGWVRKAIRQADMVVFVCRGDAPSHPLTEVETFACKIHPVPARRLVRVHDQRSGHVSGTAAWLARLPCFMHHHVALQDQVDIDSLIRFLRGRAIGFVAAGGGSLGTAHVGIYKTRRDVRHLCGHQRRGGDAGRICEEFRGRGNRARHSRYIRQEPQLPATDLAALRSAGSQGVRSCARRSIWPRLPDRGLLAAFRGGRDQSFDP